MTSEATPSTSTLLTTEELADYLKVPADTIRYWRRAGTSCPPSFKLGRHVRFRRADVDAWLGEQAARD